MSEHKYSAKKFNNVLREYGYSVQTYFYKVKKYRMVNGLNGWGGTLTNWYTGKEMMKIINDDRKMRQVVFNHLNPQ
jgi:hypothetical protein